jgi:cytosine/uracil/thiamine/allantoin permease
MATDFARKDYAHSEGTIAKSIEEQTAKLPSDAFLWTAVGAMTASATLQVMGKRHVSLFIGQWAPTFLILGLYNKLVKQLGSDRAENAI